MIDHRFSRAGVRLAAGSLGTIIGQFKAACTRRIHAAGTAHFRWQARFHDRIIRDEAELWQVRAYIAANPSRWRR